MKGKLIFITALLMCALIAGCSKKAGSSVTGNQSVFVDDIIATGTDNGFVIDINQIDLSNAQAIATITYYYEDGTKLDNLYLNARCYINDTALSDNWSASQQISNDSNDKLQQTFYFEYGNAVPNQNNSVRFVLQAYEGDGVLTDEFATIEITVDNVGLQSAAEKSETVTFKTKDGDTISNVRLMCTDMQYTLCFEADDKYADATYYFVGVDNLDRNYLFAEPIKADDNQIALHCYTLTGDQTTAITELPSDCEYINITMYEGETGEQSQESAISDEIKIEIKK